MDPELLRKWIAYARDNYDPVLTQEARDYIKKEYVNLRLASDDDEAVPITARKIEAMHRLSEASARVRLSERVELEDARRAVAIVKDCLREVGIDPATGDLDADVIETGQSQTQRQRRKNLLGIIKSNEGETEYGAPIGKIKADAEAAGIEVGKVEHDIDHFMEQGKLYEPSNNHYRTT
ncbi:MAG: hypothetical protein U5J98_07060 [Halobacteriales archaeon]|nr:hypothetical protein [Halobacteriales archaeon]